MRLSQSSVNHPSQSLYVMVLKFIILVIYKAIKERGRVSDYTADKPWQIIAILKVDPISHSDHGGEHPQ